MFGTLSDGGCLTVGSGDCVGDLPVEGVSVDGYASPADCGVTGAIDCDDCSFVWSEYAEESLDVTEWCAVLTASSVSWYGETAYAE